MELIRAPKFIRNLLTAARGAAMWSRIRDQIVAGKYEQALRNLTDLGERFPGNPKLRLLRAYCNLQSRDYGTARESLKNVEAEIASSRNRASDKQYLKLYTEYLFGYMADETGTSAELERIRSEAVEIKASVSSTIVRDFPMC